MKLSLTIPDVQTELSVRDSDNLLKIVEAKKEFDIKFEELKKNILEQMQDKGIKKVIGKGISFSVRSTGKKYNYDGDDSQFIDFEERKVKKVNSKAIDKYINANSELPDGVIQVVRKQTLVIKEEEDKREENDD